jgi:hypothetical protein
MATDQADIPRRLSPAARRSRRARWLMGFVCLVACGGCAGYMVGQRTLYPPDIQTVYVPVFDSLSYRRGLGERLTEVVVKEIELRTPFKVVNTPDADSVLTGRIVVDNKGVIVKPPTDEQRYIQFMFRVEVTWVDRKGCLVKQMDAIPLPPALVGIDQNSNYMPEAGESAATAQQRAFVRIAEQIVSLMESPW